MRHHRHLKKIWLRQFKSSCQWPDRSSRGFATSYRLHFYGDQFDWQSTIEIASEFNFSTASLIGARCCWSMRNRIPISALLRQQIYCVAQSLVGLKESLGQTIDQSEKGKQIIDAAAAFFGSGFLGVAT